MRLFVTLVAATAATVALGAGVAAAGGGEGPTIERVEPRGGPAAGGTRIELFGEPLENAKAVYFGTVRGKILEEECDGACEIVPYTWLLVESPPHKPGTVTVTFENRQGQRSSPSAGDEFTYTRGNRDGEPRTERLSASSITESSAELGARIDPHGKATQYTFSVYAAGYGGPPETVAEGELAASQQKEAVRVPVGNLEPGCSYEWWVTATNWYGMHESDRKYFKTTGAKGTECRARGG